MSKGIYTGVSDIARASKKFYIGDTDNKARKVKKMYIGDSDGKARLCYQRIFTWEKWVSAKTASQKTTYGYQGSESNVSIPIYLGALYDGSTEEEYGGYGITCSNTADRDNATWTLTVGSDFTCSASNGNFTLTGVEQVRLGNYSSGTGFGNSNYSIEQELVGKYVKYVGDGHIYKITGHSGTSYLNLGMEYYDVIKSIQYWYAYNNQGDVTSEDENAYTSASAVPSGYWSSSSNDIRTVYIRK